MDKYKGKWKCSPASPSIPTMKWAWLVAALEERDELDNTLFFYIVGDNGASAEGGMIGLFNENTYFNPKNEVRSQFHHVIDVAPTVYGAVGVPAPRTVNGAEQRPLEGVGMNYSFDKAAAPDARKTYHQV